jgi:hypothetical protein
MLLSDAIDLGALGNVLGSLLAVLVAKSREEIAFDVGTPVAQGHLVVEVVGVAWLDLPAREVACAFLAEPDSQLDAIGDLGVRRLALPFRNFTVRQGSPP